MLKAIVVPTNFISHNILICVSGLGMGGTERAAINLASWLHETGHSVGILTLQSTHTDFYACPIGVNRFSLNLSGKSSTILSGLYANIQRAWAIRRNVRQFKADVLISLGDRTNVLVLLASLGISGKKIISERCDPSVVPIGRGWGLARKLLYPCADIHVAQSQFAANWVSKHIPGLAQEVIGNAIRFSEDTISYKRDHSVQSRGKIIRLLSVGRLTTEKGHAMILNAMALIRHSCLISFELIIAGDGPLRESLEAQVVQLKLQAHVKFLGVVKDINSIYQKSDLFILSSSYEGFPNTLIEAMAHGLPIIATKCQGGVEDVLGVNNEDVALLVPKDDTNAMANAMKKLIEQPVLRMRLGLTAQERSKDYSENTIRSAWIRIISKQN